MKIGFTNQDVHKRLKQLSTGSPEKLFVYGYIQSGTKELEKDLHRRFKKLNLEWYFPTPDLLIYINSHNDMNVELILENEKLMVYPKMQIVK